ncbi:unnamed protein product [Microthlaspi erraticum]|uniref:Uncharacterized protein n=1 Tax=Microthlaspi erraticum TaxID=1685480 RepID=A0A6D2I686_9BRAS|nr:unnamed protein product [Microthlaspi erraticum]
MPVTVEHIKSTNYVLEVVAREGAVLEAVVAELEAVEAGPRLWTSADSGESVVPSVATASVTQSVSVASEASVDASVGLGAGLLRVGVVLRLRVLMT